MILGEQYEVEGREHAYDGAKLMKLLDSNAVEINDAVEELDDRGLVRRIDYKSPPFSFGQININKDGKKEYYNLKESKKSNSKMKIFISHSSEDKEMAKRIIRLLRASINLQPKDIRCTSVDGYKLPAGTNTDETLKIEVHDSAAFIGIITENSIKSSYVLFELGARWGANLPLVPIVCDKKGMSVLSGPLKNIHCLFYQNRGDIYSMIDSISDTLQINSLPTNSYLDEVDNIINFRAFVPIGSKKKNPQNQAQANTNIQNTQNKGALTQVPKHILDEIKERSSNEWKDEYDMVLHTINKQKEAYLAYKNYSASDMDEEILNGIIRRAEQEWPNEYDMILHTINKQVESRRKLDNV